MPLTKTDITERAKKTNTIEVRIESLNDTVLMRTPSIAEWRRINANHAKTLKDEAVPPMEVMVEAVGACLSDSEGKRLFRRDEEQSISDNFEFSIFMEIYQACWTNILQKDFAAEAKKE